MRRHHRRRPELRQARRAPAAEQDPGRVHQQVPQVVVVEQGRLEDLPGRPDRGPPWVVHQRVPGPEQWRQHHEDPEGVE